jgi:phage terminase large subunit-like protein
LETHVWQPPQNGKIDYSQTLEPQLEAVIQRYRVVAVAYDPYQLHDLMTRWSKNHPRIEWYAFPQGGERLQSDTSLVNRVNQGKLTHTGNAVLRQHVQNADGKPSGDKAIRIVKRENNKPIDAVVALSMAAWKASELFNKPIGIPMAQIRVKDRRVNR